MSEEFREILKERARGPGHLGHLEPEMCGRAMELILSGEATPAQIGGFLLVGRAVGDNAAELAAYARALRSFVREIEVSPGRPTVTVTGGFDGKLRTFNVGAAASLVAAAAGARVLMPGSENTPPKEGRTVFDALHGLGVPASRTLREAENTLEECGFAVTSAEHYLPELHGMLPLRREMARRTVLNVIEKLVSPASGSRMMVGITHGQFLDSIPEALTGLGVRRALVYQAVEGSDEAPLDGTSRLVSIRDGETERFTVPPDSLGLSRSAKPQLGWNGPEDESRRLLSALEGEGGPVRDLLIYNAALRLWTANDEAPLEDHVEKATKALDSGAVVELLERLRERALRLAPTASS